MNLFPELTVAKILDEKRLPMYREWAFDFDKKEFKVKHGKYYLVEGNEAIKVWIYKALKTERYIFVAYTKNYGNEISTLIGTVEDEDILFSEISRYIEESLLVNPYIISVGDFIFSHISGGKIVTKFSVKTVYGEIEEEVRVPNG